MDEEVRKTLAQLAAIAEQQSQTLAQLKDEFAAAHVLLIGIIRGCASLPGFKENVERTISEIENGSMSPATIKKVSETTRTYLYRHD
ncbi:hypothetical protein JAK38_06505 [Stenotrophomonas maltophilia]|nr:hypothetical protein [Stenotrophomonas maltophilia]